MQIMQLLSWGGGGGGTTDPFNCNEEVKHTSGIHIVCNNAFIYWNDFNHEIKSRVFFVCVPPPPHVMLPPVTERVSLHRKPFDLFRLCLHIFAPPDTAVMRKRSAVMGPIYII